MLLVVTHPPKMANSLVLVRHSDSTENEMRRLDARGERDLESAP